MANEVAVKQSYAVMAKSEQQIRDIIMGNLGGEKISIYELDSIKTPAGGSTIWTVPTLEGEKGMKEIEGIVVAKTMTRTYWSKSQEDGGDGNPDCRSNDTINGEALTDDGPGGLCENCELSKFESAAKGKGQACKLQMHLAILQGDDVLPTMLTISPSGLKSAKTEWQMRLAKAALPFYGVVTAIGLQQAQTPNGTKYAKPTFRIVRVLDEEEIARVATYVDIMKSILRTSAAKKSGGDSAGVDL